MNRNTIRIKDIAAKANVSVGTVDRVLHNRGRVSEEVRQKVLQMMDELNYEPNLIARTLGSNRTYQLVALIPRASADPYWEGPLSGIERAARDFKPHGMALTLLEYDQHHVDSFVEKATEATRMQPDGILVAPLFYRESLGFFGQWQEKNIPYVLFNTQITELQPLSYIGQDSYQSGVLAGKLLHYGQTSSGTFLIAHIGEDIANSAHLTQKEQGFRDYFEGNGLARNKSALSNGQSSFSIVSADLPKPSDVSFSRQLDRLLDQRSGIKGIFVTTSKAYEIAPYLQVYQREDIRLVGYDLLDKNIHYLNEGIIDFLINQNPIGQGYWGIASLIDHLVLKRKVMPMKYLPLDIITRENLQYYVESQSNTG